MCYDLLQKATLINSCKLAEGSVTKMVFRFIKTRILVLFHLFSSYCDVLLLLSKTVSGLTGTDNYDDAILDVIVDASTDLEDATIPLLFAKGQALVSKIYIISSIFVFKLSINSRIIYNLLFSDKKISVIVYQKEDATKKISEEQLPNFLQITRRNLGKNRLGIVLEEGSKCYLHCEIMYHFFSFT